MQPIILSVIEKCLCVHVYLKVLVICRLEIRYLPRFIPTKVGSNNLYCNRAKVQPDIAPLIYVVDDAGNPNFFLHSQMLTFVE